MKRRGIFPYELILPSLIIFIPALFYLISNFLNVEYFSVFVFHYIFAAFGGVACVALRRSSAQSGWATTLLAAPRTVRERVRTTYLYAILYCVGSWALCFACTLLSWHRTGVGSFSLTGGEAGDELPYFYPLCFLLLMLLQISLIALHTGTNGLAQSRAWQTVFIVCSLLFSLFIILFASLSDFSEPRAVLQTRGFLREIRDPLIALFIAGVLLIAASWCCSLLSEYKRLALRRPKWIRIAALLCAVLCLGAGITGGWRTVHVARVRVAEERIRIEKEKAEWENQSNVQNYIYTPHDKTAEEIKDFSEWFAEESFLGKSRTEFDRRLKELDLTKTDDYTEETNSDGIRSINHSYTLPRTGAGAYISAELDTKLGAITQFAVLFEQDLVLESLHYADYRKILTDTQPGDREISFLRQQATNGISPEKISQRVSTFDGVEEHVYDYAVKIKAFLGVLNKEDLSGDAAWLRMTVTVRDGFVTDVLPMLTTSESWETSYPRETEAALRAAETDFRSLAKKLESPMIGRSADACTDLLPGLGYATVNDIDWKTETGDRVIRFSIAGDGETIRTFQYSAPDAVKVAPRMSAAQAEALQHLVPDGSDAATLQKALQKETLLPRAILEYADQTGAVQREYICELLLTQEYDTTTQRSVTFTYLLRDGKLAETRAEFIPPMDNVS